MKYKLPKFPEFVIPTFNVLCDTNTEVDPQLYINTVDKHLEDLKLRAQSMENLNFELAQEVALRCKFLLDMYDKLLPKQKKLALGAIRYFLNETDPLNDALFAAGFDDDAQVVNYVLEKLGIEDMFINLRHY